MSGQVLVVERDDGLRDCIVRWLLQRGDVQAVSVLDFDEAVRKFDPKKHPVVIICGYYLRYTEGIQFAQGVMGSDSSLVLFSSFLPPEGFTPTVYVQKVTWVDTAEISGEEIGDSRLSALDMLTCKVKDLIAT